jgi:hypothetical protein
MINFPVFPVGTPLAFYDRLVATTPNPSTVGWAMLSAAWYPILPFGSVDLFPILPHRLTLYAFLRKAHSVPADLLFIMILAIAVPSFFILWSFAMGC